MVRCRCRVCPFNDGADVCLRRIVSLNSDGACQYVYPKQGAVRRLPPSIAADFKKTEEILDGVFEEIPMTNLNTLEQQNNEEEKE